MPTDHAGSDESGHLSLALNLSRDGILGSWAGDIDPLIDQGLQVIRRRHDYLTPALRSDLVDQELCSALSITGGTPPVDPTDATKPWPQPTSMTVATQGGAALFTMTRVPDAKLAPQIPLLATQADLRDDRMPEILEQTDDLLSFFGALTLLDETGRQFTLELLEAAVRLAIAIEMPLKNWFRVPRPIAVSRRIQPLIQTPAHAAYPSGHAAEAFMIATILHRMSKSAESLSDAVLNRRPFFAQAHRIAVNRQIAGVHFPTDSMAGAVMGCALGEWFVAMATGRPIQKFGTIDPLKGVKLPADAFSEKLLADALANPVTDPRTTGTKPIALTDMWKRSELEWS